MSEDAPSQQSFGGWNRGVKSQIRTGLGRPRLRQTKLSATKDQGSLPDQNSALGVDATKAESAINKDNSSRPPSTEKPGAAVVAHSDNAATSDEDGEIHSAFSGDDEAVVINLEDDSPAAAPNDASKGAEQSELESGELSDHSPRDSPAHAATSARGESESESEEDGQIDEADGDQGEEGEIQSEDMSMSDAYSPPSPGASSYSPPVPGTNPNAPIQIHDDEEGDSADPLAAYASGQPIPRPTMPLADHSKADLPITSELGAHGVAHAPTGAPMTASNLTLADISTTELQLQLRYYHIGRPPSSIPLTTLVRCPACAGEGHLDKSCPATTCTYCGMHQAHFSSQCPSHPQPLTTVRAGEDPRCSLCACIGHNALQCERRWRTSAWPPAKPLPPLTVQRYCYECGSGGHLGNDCPRRRPGKGMGTSSWSDLTVAGGNVPICPDAGVDEDAPGGPGVGMGRRKRRELEREKRDVDAAARDQDDGGLAGGGRQQQLPRPKRSGAIKMDGSLGSNRDDLKTRPAQQRPPPQKQQQQQQQQPPRGNFSNKRKKKKEGSGESYRPMPSAAKKAFIQGKR